MRWFFLIAVIASVAAVAFVVACASKWWLQVGAEGPASAMAERLRRYYTERSDYQIFVALPVDDPDQWVRVRSLQGDSLVLDGHSNMPIKEVSGFIVAYANGQLVDHLGIGMELPPGIQGLEAGPKRETDLLQIKEVRLGNNRIRVSYGPCAARPNDPNYYSTTLTNISNQRIRVTRFGGYQETKKGWELSTVSRAFYSSEEFREWYGLREKEWLAPGDAVTDANNYGGRPCLWAYYCESEDGGEFVAGEILE